MNDKKLAKWMAALILLPLGLAIAGGDSFRYPCQDPANWEKGICQRPLCDVTRTCPDHVFKGGRDPRIPPTAETETKPTLKAPTPGVNCK